MARADAVVHTYQDVPLPRVGTTVRGWGNPYVWEPTLRDSRGVAEADEDENVMRTGWPYGRLIFDGGDSECDSTEE